MPRHRAATARRPCVACVSQLKGIPTNLELCAAIAASEKFAAGDTTTGFLNDFHFAPHAVEVVSPGMNTTVQVRGRSGSVSGLGSRSGLGLN